MQTGVLGVPRIVPTAHQDRGQVKNKAYASDNYYLKLLLNNDTSRLNTAQYLGMTLDPAFRWKVHEKNEI